VPPQVLQLPLTQAAPLSHWLPQQGWPGSPQAAHVLFAPHSMPTSHVVPQQGWPSPPQGRHMLVAGAHW
jgi:hypothetical protein